ncbi:MAG: hypothetical protein HZB42_13255 [Sphingobacteriales bacterium]|nr:hypothetical protein [Sphingobacteriales bacterium]
MKFLSVLLLFLFAVVSCKKDENNTTPVVKTIEELLTGKTWKADEIRVQLSNNTTQYYKRGVSGNTYDTDSLKFSTNNTGTYYFSGSSYATTWNFTDAAKTKMTVIINQPPTPITVYLENIQITETFFKYAQYSSAGGISYLASCTRLPN